MLGPERMKSAVGGYGGGAPLLPPIQNNARAHGPERVTGTVGGHGGGAPPLPPIQNKPFRLLP